MQTYGWLIFALLGAAFAAVVAVLSKLAMKSADYAVVLAVQSLLMVMTLAAAVTLLGRWPQLRSAPRGALLLMAIGGVAAGLSWFFGYHALQLAHVANTTPIDKLSMPLAVVLAMVFLREKPSALNWVGIGLMLAGACCVAYTRSGGSKG